MDERFDAAKLIQQVEQAEQFQQNINVLEKSIEELKKQALKAKELHQKLQEEESATTMGADNIYDLAELFSPPMMIEMAKSFGLRGGWSVDDRVAYPVTKKGSMTSGIEGTHTRSAGWSGGINP